jgi:hypothetical protein
MVQKVRRRGVIQNRANRAAELKWNDISKYFTDISMKWNKKFPGISQEELISRLVKTAQIQKETIENTVRLGLQAKSVAIQEKQLDIQERTEQLISTDLTKQCNSVPRPTTPELQSRLNKLSGSLRTHKKSRRVMVN